MSGFLYVLRFRFPWFKKKSKKTIFWPKFQFYVLDRHITKNDKTKICGMVKINIKLFFKARVRIFSPILTKHSQMRSFTRFFTLKNFLRNRNF